MTNSNILLIIDDQKLEDANKILEVYNLPPISKQQAIRGMTELRRIQEEWKNDQ